MLQQCFSTFLVPRHTSDKEKIPRHTNMLSNVKKNKNTVAFKFIVQRLKTHSVCLDAHKCGILAEIDERHTRSSSSIDRRCSLILVFIAVRLEKPSSQRYVVEKGSNVEIALFATIGYSLAAVNQKLSSCRSAWSSFNVQSSFSSIICSCSCKVKFVTLSTKDLYGSLTQSNELVLAEGK